MLEDLIKTKKITQSGAIEMINSLHDNGRPLSEAQLKSLVLDKVITDSPTANMPVGVPTFEDEGYVVTIIEPENGTVKVNGADGQEIGAKAYPGATLTIVSTPAEGYSVDTVTVTDTDSDPVTVTDDTFVMPQKAITITVTFA